MTEKPQEDNENDNVKDNTTETQLLPGKTNAFGELPAKKRKRRNALTKPFGKSFAAQLLPKNFYKKRFFQMGDNILYNHNMSVNFDQDIK